MADLPVAGQAAVLETGLIFTRKLAGEARDLGGNVPADVIDQMDRLIAGLREIEPSVDSADAPSTQPASSPASPSSASPSSAASGNVPSPQQAGQSLASELGLPPSERSATGNAAAREAAAIAPAEMADADRTLGGDNPIERPITRFDRENPSGDDPGVDDELNEDLEAFDVSHYRVDDVVDSTRRERNNIADAIEDGAEMALAAAGPDARGGVQGRISEKEVQTNTTTLPYAVDTPFDGDDYDPDGDYRIDNPRGNRPVDNAGGLAAVRDGADGVDDIDNEDELAEALTGADRTTAPAINRIEANRLGRPSMVDVERAGPSADGLVGHSDPGGYAVGDAAGSSRADARTDADLRTVARPAMSTPNAGEDLVRFMRARHRNRLDRLAAMQPKDRLMAIGRRLPIAMEDLRDDATMIARSTTDSRLKRIAEGVTRLGADR